tara:strand:+ start:104 stop:454 length:351 start_codon:yes stop_codon:yes gene_type:complete
MAAFSKKVGVELSTVVRKVSFDIWNDVTRLTPVDTGRARASWNVNEEYANLATKSEDYKGSGQGVVGKISGKKDVIISNNVEYIVHLEDGSSTQAPAGMTKLAVANAAASITNTSI